MKDSSGRRKIKAYRRNENRTGIYVDGNNHQSSDLEIRGIICYRIMGYKILKTKRAFKERELGDRDEDYLLVTREGECYQRLISKTRQVREMY